MRVDEPYQPGEEVLVELDHLDKPFKAMIAHVSMDSMFSYDDIIRYTYTIVSIEKGLDGEIEVGADSIILRKDDVLPLMDELNTI